MDVNLVLRRMICDSPETVHAPCSFSRSPGMADSLAEEGVFAEACPFFGAFNFTPARRALERPMATACFVDRAPCLPARIWCISSRTNSPACVDGDFPSRLSFAALLSVSFSGISPPPFGSDNYDNHIFEVQVLCQRIGTEASVPMSVRFSSEEGPRKPFGASAQECTTKHDE